VSGTTLQFALLVAGGSFLAGLLGALSGLGGGLVRSSHSGDARNRPGY